MGAGAGGGGVQNIPKGGMRQIHFCGANLVKTHRVLFLQRAARRDKRKRRHLSVLETNLYAGLVNTARISSPERRNPDYVFDTANPANPHRDPTPPHLPHLAAVSASTSLARADQAAC